MRILLLIFAFTITSYTKAQDNLKSLIETPIGQSEENTKLFLKGVLQGKDPGRQIDPEGFIVYDLDNSYHHIEYRAKNNKCVIVAVRFKASRTSFLENQNDIMLTSEKSNELWLRKTPSGQLIIYDFDQKNMIIVAMTFEFVMNSK